MQRIHDLSDLYHSIIQYPGRGNYIVHHSNINPKRAAIRATRIFGNGPPNNLSIALSPKQGRFFVVNFYPLELMM